MQNGKCNPEEGRQKNKWQPRNAKRIPAVEGWRRNGTGTTSWRRGEVSSVSRRGPQRQPGTPHRLAKSGDRRSHEQVRTAASTQNTKARGRGKNGACQKAIGD
ncbi:unnamed protein product [Prunus armeniaca]|uniref:Uncharacterized protein n=1 Tax=Prunus armeniaca TaxID=36596 RepID=A0A6J5VWR7_PRUAR|nr:unnamed protein product [Prunus armeniaca]